MFVCQPGLGRNVMKFSLKYNKNKYDTYIEKIIESIKKHFQMRAINEEDPYGLYANFRSQDQYNCNEEICDHSFKNTGLSWGYYRNGHLGGSTYCTLALLYYEEYKKNNYEAAEKYNPYSIHIPQYGSVESKDLLDVVFESGRSLNLQHTFVDNLIDTHNCPNYEVKIGVTPNTDEVNAHPIDKQTKEMLWTSPAENKFDTTDRADCCIIAHNSNWINAYTHKNNQCKFYAETTYEETQSDSDVFFIAK